MKHKTLHAITLIALAITVCVGGWYVYGKTLGRPMFEGETFHDFGVVMIDDYETVVTHTFTLVNNSSENIIVNDIKSSCKCTIPELQDRRVMPGKTLELFAELTVRNSGLLKTEIFLLLGDGRVQRLYVQALGRRELPLTYLGLQIELLLNLPKVLPIVCEVYDKDDEPLPLMVKTSKGVTAIFKRWRMVKTYDEKWMNPAKWEAQLVLTRTEMELPEGAAVDVSLDGEKWLSVPINRPDLIKEIMFDQTPGSVMDP